MAASSIESHTFPSPTSNEPSPRPQRVLACTSCQQRKLKCDRKFPCAKCVKSGLQCIPAGSVPKVRRKRFAERELLDRLRHYENLLRQHNVDFETLRPGDDTVERVVTMVDTPAPTPASAGSASSRSAYVATHEAKDLWQAMKRTTGEEDHAETDDRDSPGTQPDVVRGEVFQRAYDQVFESIDHSVFTAFRKDLDVATLHPPSPRIFKLWQIFLDNVHPLLKVTHMPSLQARIVDATEDLTKINFTMHAVMFSIYSMAVHSLDEEACNRLFQTPKREISSRYQLACQQALLGCRAFSTNDRECLAALLLYLVSFKPPVTGLSANMHRSLRETGPTLGQSPHCLE